MKIYTLTKFNSISSETASVNMECNGKNKEIVLPRVNATINRKYINYRKSWKRLSKYRVSIKKIKYRNENNGYTSAKIDIIENFTKEEIPTDKPQIKGFFSIIYEEEEIDILGFWESSNKGLFFNVISYDRILKIDAVAIKNYIKAAVPGLGSKMITNIINYFGANNVLNIIKDSPQELLKVKGIGPKAIIKISDGIGQACILEGMFEFMSKFDIPSSVIINIYKEFGLNAEETVKKNPYKLVENFLLSLSDCDKLGKYLGFKYNSPERIRALIICYLKEESENKGDMFTFLESLIKNLSQYSNKHGNLPHKALFLYDEIWSAMNLLNKDEYVYIENHPIDGICIYHSYYKIVEDKICSRLSNLLKGVNTLSYNSSKIDNLIELQEGLSKIKMASKQKEAIHMAIKNKFSILTGGPGTGKTQTINSIIKIIKVLYPNVDIGLCAPTGKASKRMSELTGLPSYTIHKKLKCTPFSAVSDLEELECDFLIIDEASMIDADLFYKLLTSVKNDANILLVGDYHQLPSVGVGLILRDLIESNVIPTTELTEVFRQKGESPIIELSQLISKGEHLRKNSKYISRKLDFHFDIQKDNIGIQKEIIKTIKSVIDSKIMPTNSIQVLMPVNHGDIGMVILNQKIQNLLNPDIGQNKYELSPFMELREGDRVMQIKNNYNLGIFNGSVGYIKKITFNNDIEMICEFDGEEKIYEGYDMVEELVLAYAITIHKSQGSEFPLVIMPISKSYGNMISRNLLYTAITRAQKYLRVIGDLEAFNDGIDNTDIVSRNSHIREKLVELLK